MMPASEFDEMYVISDLHIGGPDWKQIFNQGELLAAFIRSRAKGAAERRVALIINGDTVDFIADRNAKYFDPEGAIGKLDAIMDDENFADVFNALSEFIAKQNRYLVITLGNHDLELALPWVREHFRGRLAAGDDAARGRITLAFDGTGYTARVGDKSVICVHGNEFDEWNVCDYETLRRQGRDLHRGRPVEPWTPNAGTKLVVDAMNDIKKRYAFVDLLKPETKLVIPTLVALDPEKKPELSDVLGVVSRLGWDKMRKLTGFLSAGEEEEAGTLLEKESIGGSESLDRLLGETFRDAQGGQTDDGNELLDALEDDLEKDPLDMLEGDGGSEQLGAISGVWNWMRGKGPEELLYEALKKLVNNEDFKAAHKDDTYRRVTEHVSGFDIVCTGHTHFEKSISQGGRQYFNSGTWVPVIKLTEPMMESLEKFKRVYKIFSACGSVEEFEHDQNRFSGESLLLKRPAVVEIVSKNGAATASLKRVERTDTGVQLTIPS
jgi:UDP-2,3-diacylglucosamine pyrophosphatase LpxH